MCFFIFSTNYWTQNVCFHFLYKLLDIKCVFSFSLQITGHKMCVFIFSTNYWTQNVCFHFLYKLLDTKCVFSFSLQISSATLLILREILRDIVINTHWFTWLQLIFTSSFDWNHKWTDGAFVMLVTSLRMGRTSWKGFQKMASRNLSNTFTVAGRIIQLYDGSILMEI